MKVNVLLVSTILFVLCSSTTAQSKTYVQTDTTKQFIELSLLGGYTSNKVVPFWMRSNQFGSVPLDGISGGIQVRALKNYNSQSTWNWGYGIEARSNIGNKAEVQLIDAHVKVRYAMFEAKLGRTKDVMGLNGDTLLSSGNFSVSGNALGIPKIDIAIPEYYRLPWFGGLFSFKGNFANGYMGKKEIHEREFLIEYHDYLPTFLHQKSLYGRLGKQHWRLNLYGGINHQAQWGSEKKVFGDAFTLNTTETFWYVLWGKVFGSDSIKPSKIGNQLGSIDLSLSYDWDNIQFFAYRQNFYDIGAISKLANIADGLNGITLTNKGYNQKNKNWDWHKVLVEFFYSKDQAGYPWSKFTQSKTENYYNNYFYNEGWSYNKRGIGSPLIALVHEARIGQVTTPSAYFISNRVIAGHLASSGRVYQWSLLGKLTYSKHYGTFATSIYGEAYKPGKETFIPVSQFSAYIDAERSLSNNFFFGFRLAVDQGNMFDNSIGGQVSLRKQFKTK